MKITNVKATALKGYKDWNFVRIETDKGIIGLGEAHPGEGITDVIVKRLKPLLVGKDPLNVEPLYHHMIGRTIGQSVGGTMLGAIGGVETAQGAERAHLPTSGRQISRSIAALCRRWTGKWGNQYAAGLDTTCP